MEGSTTKTLQVFLDTSYLRKGGFNDPDFRKLLEHSKKGELKVFVSHIAWEELRTQLLENATANVLKVQKEFDALKAILPSNFILSGLAAPALTLWNKIEIVARSHDAMTAFAKENKIEIVPLAPDHGPRTWERYFDIGVPFNPDEKRENRRKDIPDAWILEAAIDVNAKHPGLLALCLDGRLSDALKAASVRVFKETQGVLDEIEAALAPQPMVEVQEAPGIVPPVDIAIEAGVDRALTATLTMVQEQFRGIDGKVLGYVAYLDSPTKDQLLQLLSRSGTAVDVARNVAERLAIAGLITDTGNHYLLANKEAGDLAAKSVEAEIIKLLEAAG